MAQETNKLTPELLNEKNYLAWAKSVTISLSGRGKLGHVTGTKKMPVLEKLAEPTAEETKSIDEWQMIDHLVMSWVLASIDPRLARMFLYSNSAKELWEKIRTTYGQQNNYSYIYQLKQQISQAKQGARSHTEYMVEYNAKLDELAEYLPPTTDPVEIEKRQEHDKVYFYLGGLNSSFDAVRSQILLSPELPSYSAVLAMVQREDSRRTVMSSEVQGNHQGADNVAFAVSTSNLDRGRNKGEKCSHCKRSGHTHERCWVLHPHLKPKWRGDGGGRGHGEAAKRFQKTLDGEGEKRGLLTAREEMGQVDAVKREGEKLTSQSDERLGRIESLLAELMRDRATQQAQQAQRTV